MSLSRRQLLHGFSLGAGSVLLTPMLRQLEAQAAGADSRSLPKRVVFVVEGNGVNPEQIQPTNLARQKNAQNQNNSPTLQDVSLADLELSKALEPLAPFKSKLAILQGLSSRVCGGGHSNNFGALGVYSSKKGPIGETIDVALGKALPGVFPQIGLGISDRPEHSVIYNISAYGGGKAAPVQCRPDLAYSQLFGSAAEGNAKRQFQAHGNLLDFLIDDVKRIESQVAGPEKDKLHGYLNAFESMKDRHSRLNEIQNTLRAQGPVVSDKYKSEVETDRLDAHFDLAAASLICGVTNVVTIASGAGDPYFSVRFKGLGIDLDKHSIGHGKSFKDMTWDQMAITIRRFHMELIARLATKLQSVPEGDGTMLDNTLIVYLSDAAESHHSRCWEWPIVLLGNLGGRLKTNGRYLCWPKYGQTGHRTVANLYLTLLQAIGAPRDKFGLMDPNLKDLDQSGPLGELLA